MIINIYTFIIAIIALAYVVIKKIGNPRVEYIYKYVRPRYKENEFHFNGKDFTPPTGRLWVQNPDNVLISEFSIEIETPDACPIQSCRAVGAVGRWEPKIRFESQSKVIIYNDYGLRPHATWRVELEFDDNFTEFTAESLDKTASFGTSNNQFSTSSRLNNPLVSLSLTTLSIIFIYFAFITNTLELQLGEFLSKVFDVELTSSEFVKLDAEWSAFQEQLRKSWLAWVYFIGVLCVGSASLYFIIKPTRTSVMSGWLSKGKKISLSTDTEPHTKA